MKLLCNMLKRYNVVEATTAEEALMLFIDLNHDVDLLVADLTLPRMSGIQVALLLRSKLPAVPVILTSGYPVAGWSHRDSADLARLGSHSVTVLQKPFPARALSRAVCDLIGNASSEMPATA
jgi:CheY-like chemotaxis protein